MTHHRYWNQLEVPQRVADLALLFHNVSEDMDLHMLNVMKRADCKRRTGANFDGCINVLIKRAVLEQNTTLLSASFALLWGGIKIVQPTDAACLLPPPGTQGCATDGIQIDFSFHQQ